MGYRESIAEIPLFVWRQIWRVAGRESGSPELLGSPRTSPEASQTSLEVFRQLLRKFSHCGTYQQPEVPRKFPKLPRKFPKLPRKFPDFPGGQPLSLGSLTPSPDSQKLSLIYGGGRGIAPPLRVLSEGETLRKGGSGYRTQLAKLRHQKPHSA